jgi:hypothetical protein
VFSLRLGRDVGCADVFSRLVCHAFFATLSRIMDELIKTLPGILRSVGGSKEVVEAAVIAAWKHAAGEGLRNHATPFRLEGKTLVVAVADAVWQKQLGAMKGLMLFRINTILGQALVSQIDLRIDPRIANTRPSAGSETKEQMLDDEVPLELWSAASAIKDKQLRQVFLKAVVSSIKRLENS